MKTELLIVGDGKTPIRAYATDSGVDVYANKDIMVRETVVIPTGISLQVNIVGEPDPGYNKTWTFGIFVHERSGLASKGLRLGGGVIDNSYTGELGIIASHADGFEIKAGQKIAQLVTTRVELPTIRRVERFDTIVGNSDRAGRGFGSTGSV